MRKRERGHVEYGTQYVRQCLGTFFLLGEIFSPSGFQSGLGFRITNPSSTEVSDKY